MDGVADGPPERRRRLRRQREAAGGGFGERERAQPAMDLARRRAREIGLGGGVAHERIAERRVLARRAHRSTHGVDVVRRWRVRVRAHPLREARARREPLAVREDRREPRCGAGGQLVDERRAVAVDVAQKREVARVGRRRQAVEAQVVAGRVVEEDEAREVQPVELPERHERVRRFGGAGLAVHRREEGAQRRFPFRGDARQDQKGRLWSHPWHHGGARRRAVPIEVPARSG